MQRIQINLAIVTIVQHRHTPACINRLDRHPAGLGPPTRPNQPLLINPHQQVHMPEHMPERRHVLQHRDATAALPHPLEHLLDLPLRRLVLRERLDADRRAEHEIHHRRDAPPDVVLDHHLAPPALITPLPVPNNAMGQPHLLSRAIPTTRGARAHQSARCPDQLNRIPVVRPELLIPRPRPTPMRPDRRPRLQPNLIRVTINRHEPVRHRASLLHTRRVSHVARPHPFTPRPDPCAQTQ